MVVLRQEVRSCIPRTVAGQGVGPGRAAQLQPRLPHEVPKGQLVRGRVHSGGVHACGGSHDAQHLSVPRLHLRSQGMELAWVAGNIEQQRWVVACDTRTRTGAHVGSVAAIGARRLKVGREEKGLPYVRALGQGGITGVTCCSIHTSCFLLPFPVPTLPVSVSLPIPFFPTSFFRLASWFLLPLPFSPHFLSPLHFLYTSYIFTSCITQHFLFLPTSCLLAPPTPRGNTHPHATARPAGRHCSSGTGSRAPSAWPCRSAVELGLARQSPWRR